MFKGFSSNSSMRMIRCHAADQTYCIELSEIAGIQQGDRLLPSVESNGSIGRLSGLRENVPVFSLTTQLGGSPIPKRKAGPILLINSNSKQWALMVDGLHGIIEPASSDIHSLPSIADNKKYGFFKGVVRVGEELSLHINPQRLHPDAISNLILNEGEQGKSTSVSHSNDHKKSCVGRAGKILVFSFVTTDMERRQPIFGLSISQVAEILEPLPITPVPALPRYVSGLVNWRNRPVPVIDLSIRLGLGAPINRENERQIIVRLPGNGGFVGFPARSDTKVRSLPLAHRPSNCDIGINRSFVKGVFKSNGEILVIPNVDSLVC